MKKLPRRKFLESCLRLSASAAISFSVLPGSASFFKRVAPVPDLDRITGLLQYKDPIIWVLTGDSITHGAKHTHGYRSYPEIFAERIRWELSRTRDVIINTGISGNTTQNILDDFDFRIRQFKPQVVSFMFGTNDCAKGRVSMEAFARNLNTLVRYSRDQNSIPILHTPNLIITEKDPSRSMLEKYAAIIRNVAGKEEVILVDNYKYWQETSRQNTGIDIFKNWLNDPLHPNGEGHVQIARLLFKELSIFDARAPSCGAPYYEGEH